VNSSLQEELGQYPDQIAQLQKNILRKDQQIQAVERHIEPMILDAERVVYFDPELKNESQRKGRRAEILDTAAYLEAQQTFEQLKNERAELVIELERVRNHFSVAKLRVREQIASLEGEF
jgi:ribonuclease HIII